MKIKTVWGLYGLLSIGILNTGCGGSSGAASNLNSLGALPSMSTLVGTSASSSSSSMGFYAVDADAVPELSDITPENADDYFWNGRLASLTNSESDREFFETGMGACRMADTVSRSFDEIMRQTSVCYIKGMANLENPPISPLPSEPMGQEATTKLYQVNVSGMEGEDDQKIFISIAGEDVKPDSYSLTLYFCGDGDTVEEFETIEVNRRTGVFSSSSQGGHGEGKNSRSVTAKIEAANGGTFRFDPDAEKSATVSWEGLGDNAGNKFKGKIIIDGDQMQAWSFFEGTFNDGVEDHSFVDKNYAITNISGSSVSTLKFLEGAFKGLSDGEDWDYNYSGGVEFVDYYQSLLTGSLYETASAFDLSTDSFFTAGGASVSVDTSGYDCTATPDYVVTMDFTSPDVAALSDECEGDRREGGNYICDSDAVRDAQQTVYSH